MSFNKSVFGFVTSLQAAYILNAVPEFLVTFSFWLL